jgi:penicillin-insensitive murein endopeptidase
VHAGAHAAVVALAVLALAGSARAEGPEPKVGPGATGGSTARPPGLACSNGAAWNGRLEGGIPMDVQGDDYVLHGGKARQRTAYGTPEMITLLKRGAAVVGEMVDGPPLVIGSISAQSGGKLGRHKSHQTGRDVDIVFYARDPEGKRHRGVGFYDFDGAGNCVHARCKGWSFDVQRNWWLVRTLVWSKRPEVQYIFVSDPLRKLMLDYARKRQEHPEILRRAERVLAQPGNSSPHADHFHVRIYCSAKDKTRGCRDGGPTWDWISKR